MHCEHKVWTHDMNNADTILGMDLGSRSVKMCVMASGSIERKKCIESMEFYRSYGVRTDDGFTIDISGLGYTGIDRIIATGYGRMSAELTGADSISELKAHFLGARFQAPYDTFTLLDIGGQDYKVMRIKDGKMIDMATNDKCAASTGRYLENMADVLGISIEDIGEYYKNPANLSNTCAIFGESELIGLIVRGEPLHRLAAGVNRSVVERVLPLIERMNENIVVMSGGVARNDAIVKMLGSLLSKEIYVLDEPLYNGAIGCCLSGCD